MQKLPIHQLLPASSPLVAGCMGLGGSWDQAPLTDASIGKTRHFVEQCLELGITTFDHADIYTLGKAEAAFGSVLKANPSLRQQMVLQTKCGIRFADDEGPKRYDFSPAWVTQSVEQSLQRLNTDYVDVLLLHRPDPLMDADALAGALNGLVSGGKVKHIGVSNMNWQQIDLLADALGLPIAINQIQMSLDHLGWLDDGVTVGDTGSDPVNFTSGTLEYCQRNNIQVQSWGSLAGGLFSGKSADSDSATVQATAAAIESLASEHGTSREAIVLAWLLRHPSCIQPVIGTTQPERLRACAQSLDVNLTRGQWYRLYVLARGSELP